MKDEANEVRSSVFVSTRVQVFVCIINVEVSPIISSTRNSDLSTSSRSRLQHER